MRPHSDFRPERYEQELIRLIDDLRDGDLSDPRSYDRILRRHPKDGKGPFKKSEIIRAYRHFADRYGWADERSFVARLRMKPVRTLSGVAPVTVLTKPYACPGRCVFCPNDVRMPKSYLSMEPGAQRAAQHAFDPFAQTASRLQAFFNNGHDISKAELIILGGTWSFYPESYQVWFVKRCLDAMNTFSDGAWRDEARAARTQAVDWAALDDRFDGRSIDRSYNQIVRGHYESTGTVDLESESWAALERAQEQNVDSAVRCVGLVLETRPDHIDEAEVERIRRLGATKVQIGYQSLSDEILEMNQRGHDVAATRRAMGLLRQAGFKIHAHWMPNLYGATPERDIEDFARVFGDRDFRPDELKVYPCSLIETAELMTHYEAGRWRPYDTAELLEVLSAVMSTTPEYCRLTRVIRDIPSHDIVVGNKQSNLRQVVEMELSRRGLVGRDIRAREIRGEPVSADTLTAHSTWYETQVSDELFLQYVTPDDRIAAFLRLSLPRSPTFLAEIARSAMIREVHVYGEVAGVGQPSQARAQHLGLGRRLIERAAEIAEERGFSDLAVISAIGTRAYYRRLGFTDGALYLHRSLDGAVSE